MQMIALQLMVAGLSLLVQIGNCETPQCLQGRALALQAISISQDLQSGKLSIIEPQTVTPQTTQTIILGSPVIENVAPVAQIAQQEPLSVIDSYTTISHIPPVKTEDDKNIIEYAKTTYNIHVESNRLVKGQIVIYSGNYIIPQLTKDFHATSTDYQVENVWSMQMSYQVIIDGQEVGSRKRMQPNAL